MKRFLLIVICTLLVSPLELLARDTYVQGYLRKDGTYVAPHHRSAPDKSYNNNWSTYPNTNPYTGKMGANRPTWNDQAPYDGWFGNDQGWGNDN